MSATASVTRVCDNDTAMPAFTSDAACFRLASVTRFIVPSWSSLPQRPQFEIDLKRLSYSAIVCGPSCGFLKPRLADSASSTTIAWTPPPRCGAAPGPGAPPAGCWPLVATAVPDTHASATSTPAIDDRRVIPVLQCSAGKPSEATPRTRRRAPCAGSRESRIEPRERRCSPAIPGRLRRDNMARATAL